MMTEKRTMWSRLRLSLATGILAVGAASAFAEAPQSTLQRIADTGSIRIGYSAEDLPFSYRMADGTITGYSTELCLKIVDRLKAKVQRDDIKVEFVERSPRNRVAMLRNGDFDIECVASTNNAERRKSVAFTYSHFVAGTQFVSLKKNGLNTIADLAGHTVVATAGTTNISQLNAANRERGLHIAVMPVETHTDAFKMVREGRASAFVMDGILLAAMIANSGQPDDYSLSTETLGEPEPYGLMVRHDDVTFRDEVNLALKEIYATGEIQALYEKWFNQPVPPNGINLRAPMPKRLQDFFASPTLIAD